MAWGRRRRSYSAPTLRSRDIHDADFWELKRLKSKGKPTVLKLLCDGGKIHKITFYDRGPVKLHNHHIKAERALGELGQDRMPRCMSVLACWKEHPRTIDFALQRRMSDVIAFRNYVSFMRTRLKQCNDADGLDLDHAKRLLAILDAWKTAKRESVCKMFPADRNHWSYRGDGNPEYIDKAKIDVNKLLVHKAERKVKLTSPRPSINLDSIRNLVCGHEKKTLFLR